MNLSSILAVIHPDDFLPLLLTSNVTVIREAKFALKTQFNRFTDQPPAVDFLKFLFVPVGLMGWAFYMSLPVYTFTVQFGRPHSTAYTFVVVKNDHLFPIAVFYLAYTSPRNIHRILVGPLLGTNFPVLLGWRFHAITLNNEAG